MVMTQVLHRLTNSDNCILELKTANVTKNTLQTTMPDGKYMLLLNLYWLSDWSADCCMTWDQHNQACDIYLYILDDLRLKENSLEERVSDSTIFFRCDFFLVAKIWVLCERINLKEQLFNANKLTWFHVSLLSRLFVLTDELLCCVVVLYSYQSGEEDWEPANRTLSPGHCRRILARFLSEKQESRATVSMKNKKHFILFIAHRSRSVSQSPLAYLQYVSI